MSDEQGEARGSFATTTGFILAVAASAVGLGNLWRFPYLTSHYGGGIFVLVYIIFAATFGFSLMITELAIGRKTGKSCIEAFGALSEKHRWIGIVTTIIPIFLLTNYCVIGGWVIKWFATTATGNLSTLAEDGGGYWWSYITGDAAGMGDPTLWFLIFIALCIICIHAGLNKGIEKISKITMPLLLLMIVGIIIYEFTLPGMWDGLVFYLNPDVSKLSTGTLLGAISQVFFSMSLAAGVMITYGSYLKKEVNIEKSVRWIGLIDTGVAILAGMMIVPPAYIFGFDDSNGMGLMFVALPQVFEQMTGGEFIAPIFYLLVLFAALTSAVSMFETIVSVFVDRVKLKRKASILASTVLIMISGTIVVMGFGPLMIHLSPLDQGMGLLGLIDTLDNSFLMPIIAILTCIFVGYVVKTKLITDELESEGNTFTFKKTYNYMIRYVCPICLAAILVFGTLDILGILSIY